MAKGTLKKVITETAWAEIWRDVTWDVYKSPDGSLRVEKPRTGKDGKPIRLRSHELKKGEVWVGKIDRVSLPTAKLLAKRQFS